MTDAWDIKYKNYVHTISIVLMIRYTLQWSVRLNSKQGNLTSNFQLFLYFLFSLFVENRWSLYFSSSSPVQVMRLFYFFSKSTVITNFTTFVAIFLHYGL